MKYLSLSLSACFLLTACSSSDQTPPTVQPEAILVDTVTKTLPATTPTVAGIKPKQFSISDTTFLLRELKGSVYHAVFIEHNKNSEGRKRLTDFTVRTEYGLSTSKQQHKATKVKKFDLGALPREWLPLYQYRNKYYLYAPSDWGNTGRRVFTDSTLVQWYLDGPYPYLLTKFKKTKTNQFRISTRDPHNNQDVVIKPEEIEIIMIDPRKGLAVWKYNSAGSSEVRYRLMVSKKHSSDFELVVNYCKSQKHTEYDGFEDIDFEALLYGK